ncbi:MAG: aminotransferase class III-fold pyridoxal phosphate-dependent enzyme [Pseudomonadota bacterium]|nr:aminotransferase class III-fold pyridoxal phosphate-dependent enzyme [Pseudomonadota bacterium]
MSKISTAWEQLKQLRVQRQHAQTLGLSDASIDKFIRCDDKLQLAIARAFAVHNSEEWQEFLRIAPQPEDEQIALLQERLYNFYELVARNPYIPLGAAGPWLITSFGAVLHDSGGYGMLGFGHAVPEIEQILGQTQVLANIMTANILQRRIRLSLDAEIGHTRNSTPVYGSYMFLNSGSEAVTLASRIVDVHAKQHADDRQRTVSLVHNSSFHGRTERPSRLSDMCTDIYSKHLHSFKRRDDVQIIQHNDEDDLRSAFATAEQQGYFIDAIYLEPVTGEGNPGRAITPDYYRLAQQLAAQHGALLTIDSVQAGIRTHGVLSVVDYPGFQHLPAPDIEVFSKALHSGHIPLSAVAVSTAVAKAFPPGLHGNTMTAVPRSLAVGCYTLSQLTPDVRSNIVARGQQFLERFEALREELPDIITHVQGKGLLFCVGINHRLPVVGGVEKTLRKQGIGVIHGNTNVLRFTPHFRINADEVELVVHCVGKELRNLRQIK